MNWLQKIGTIAAITIALGTVLAGVDHRYGPRVQVEANAADIARIKLERDKRAIERRIWDLEDEFGFQLGDYPHKYRNEYRRLQSDLLNIQRELDRL